MPLAAPRVCACGKVVAAGVVCACRRKRDQERKARFDKTRPNAHDRGYNHEWRRKSSAFLVANPKCQHPGCGAYATVVHHKIAHKGDQRLFWDQRNWQGLCAHHHNADAQRMECR